MAKYIFLAVFLCSAGLQLLRWIPSIPDGSIWTQAAKVVETNNPSTFPKLDAYMHPGGPDIEGTILAEYFTHVPYLEAIQLFLTMSNSLLIALLCSLCYLLRKNVLWVLTVFGLLTFQSIFAQSSLYDGLTPPSITLSLALPLACLYTLYLYEKEGKPKISLLILWCAIIGFLPATRIDAGGFMAAILLLLLATKFNLKTIVLLVIGSSISFFLFDPFMWFNPISQVVALFSAMLNHYGGPGQGSIAYCFSALELVITLPLLSIFFGAVYLFFRKEIVSPIPRIFLAFMLASTAIVTGILLSSHQQTERYISPFLFLWVILLPLFIFSLIDRVDFSFLKTPEGKKKGILAFKILIMLLLICPLANTFVKDVISNNLLTLL